MQRRGQFRVSVAKDDLVFSSAHFITFTGHRCEGLHGHNYRARVTIEGELDEDTGWVIDFVEIKQIMRGLCEAIDHLVLLPLESSRIGVVEEGEAVHVAVDRDTASRVVIARSCPSRTRRWRCCRDSLPIACARNSTRLTSRGRPPSRWKSRKRSGSPPSIG